MSEDSAQQKKVLVTGGAGFIGSHVVDRLVEEGFDVMVLDDLSNGKLINLQHHLKSKGVRFVLGDVQSERAVKSCVKKAGYVVHLAAIASVERSIRDPMAAHEANATGTINLLSACLESKIKRVVYASSCAVYGDPVQLPITEAHPLNPISTYAVAKLAGEGYCRAFTRTYGMETVGLRMFNVYGPRQSNGDYGGVIAKFVNKLANNQPPIIYGDGKQSRDFINVQDVADAFVKALLGEAGAGEVYNVGTGRATTVNELVGMLQRILGREDLQPSYIPAMPGEIRESRADITKAMNELDFRPSVGLEEGLGRLLGKEIVYADK